MLNCLLVHRPPERTSTDISDLLRRVDLRVVHIPVQIDHQPALRRRGAWHIVPTALDRNLEVVRARVLHRERDVLRVLHERDDLGAAFRVHGPSRDRSLIVGALGRDEVALEGGREVGDG